MSIGMIAPIQLLQQIRRANAYTQCKGKTSRAKSNEPRLVRNTITSCAASVPRPPRPRELTRRVFALGLALSFSSTSRQVWSCDSSFASCALNCLATSDNDYHCARQPVPLWTNFQKKEQDTRIGKTPLSGRVEVDDLVVAFFLDIVICVEGS